MRATLEIRSRAPRTAIVILSATSSMRASCACWRRSRLLRAQGRHRRRTGGEGLELDRRPRQSTMRVLIADDDAVSRTVLGAAVRRLGHECAGREDGLEAWRMFSRLQPDVLITDWQMPGMDGTQLVSPGSRDACLAAYTYVMVLTGDADGEAARASMSAGADDLLRKPLRPAELERKLIAARRLIDLHRNSARTRSRTLYGHRNRRRLNEDLEGCMPGPSGTATTTALAIADIDRFKGLNDNPGTSRGTRRCARSQRPAAPDAQRRQRLSLRRRGVRGPVPLSRRSEAPCAPPSACRAPWRRGHRPPGRRAGDHQCRRGRLRGRREQPEEVLARADRALYLAKALGGNRWRWPRRPRRPLHAAGRWRRPRPCPQGAVEVASARRARPVEPRRCR